MLSGFNTNLCHRGVLFHVQTEDSGRANPHIISHLFHGGNILVSRKSDYRDLLEKEDVLDTVREMMEQQHKDMLRSLIRGSCDEQIIGRLGADAFGKQTPAVTETFLETSEVVSDDAQPTERDAISTIEPEEASQAPPPVAAVESSKERIARAFGDGVVSQKPLDEVVLDYLVESARKRKRPPS